MINGEYLSNGWYTIKNMGTMTINNMKFGNNVNNGSSLIVNGYYGNAANDRGQVEGDTVMMTINGGAFENHNNSCNVVKNDDFGKLVIEGGTFIASSNDTSNANPVVQNWHKATINNGTFTSKNGVVLANGFLDQTADAGEDGYIRKYYMIRVHDNKTDILDVVVGDNNTFSFETDKFSTYALAYKDVVKTISSPNTFDGGIVYIITLLFGFGLLLFSNKYLKRFN